jgi:phosphoserine phosphatase
MLSDNAKIVACDVCDTLYHSNTTFDFLNYTFKKNSRVRYFILCLVTRKWSPLYYLLAVVGELSGQDLVRTQALKLLRGKSIDAASGEALDFYENFLRPRANKDIFTLLGSETCGGKKILVSSSIDVVVKIIAHKNNMDFFSSTLEVKEDRLTGRLKNDLSSRKHEIVKTIMKQSGFQKLVVITDNKSDFELVALADERYVVVSSERERKFWKELQPNFVSGTSR